MAAETPVVLKEGMKISEQELLALGYKFGSTFAFDSKIFEKEGKFVHWNKDTHVIWRILPDN